MKGKENTSRQEADWVLQGGTAITVDSERRVIRNAGIAVRGEDIAFLGKATEVSERYQAKRALDCNDKVLIPGLVNAHIHYSHHLSRGLIPDNLGARSFPTSSTLVLRLNPQKSITCKEEVSFLGQFAKGFSPRVGEQKHLSASYSFAGYPIVVSQILVNSFFKVPFLIFDKFLKANYFIC